MVFEIGKLSGNFDVSEETLLVGGVQIIASVMATVLVDMIGRRILLVFSSTFMGIFLVLLGNINYYSNATVRIFKWFLLLYV